MAYILKTGYINYLYLTNPILANCFYILDIKPLAEKCDAKIFFPIDQFPYCPRYIDFVHAEAFQF